MYVDFARFLQDLKSKISLLDFEASVQFHFDGFQTVLQYLGIHLSVAYCQIYRANLDLAQA